MRTIKISLTNIMKLVDISTRMITTAYILFTLYRFSDFNSVSSFAEAFENVNSHLMNLGTTDFDVPRFIRWFFQAKVLLAWRTKMTNLL